MASRAEAHAPAWQRGKVASWLVTTDHKRIGILYIGTALAFFVLAGLMALAMRLQLAQANADVLSADRYNELVTIHGTAMVFLVVVPILAGFGNFLVPLMMGARDVAFPRLNALSYWLFAFGGAVLMLSFFANGGAAKAGWTAYPPLSTEGAGNGQDLWILSLYLVAAASLACAINFLVPILAGFGNFLVPLMIGVRDVAFPRLNALSYWLFAFGGAVLMLSFFATGGAAKAGWTAYPPLSTEGAGNGQDLWILSLYLVAAASLACAINFLVTIHNMRTRGMTWARMPLFVWSIALYAWLLVVILPVLSAGLTLLLLDRGISFGPWEVQTHFFDAAEGGAPLLYQHAFWFFGHPAVYVIVLPAMGIISEVLPVFARKPIFSYRAIAVSTVAIGAISMLAWGQHLFAAGLPYSLQAFFMVSSMVIAVPTGVKIFTWLATLWRGNLSLDTPMLFALGFLSLFVLGGLTGIYLAAFPIDWQVHDTYFVVAHFHYTLFGGVMFAIFAGLFYWWPKMFGRLLDEKLGKWQFCLLFVGFNLAFFPQHLVGLDGMVRRIYTYSNESWEGYNLASTIGSYVMGLAILLFLVNVVRTSRSGPRVGNDPWQADTLEWYTTSPPPPHNFEAVPYVTSARPLYDLRRRLREKSGFREL